MKKIMLTVFFVILSAIGVFAQTMPNYSGEWALDIAKSKLSQTRFNSWAIKVSQTEKELKVETATKSERGEQTGTDIYSLEGKETKSEAGSNQGRGTATLKAAKEADGKLTLISTRKVNSSAAGEYTMTIKDVWELVDGGKAIKVMRELNTPNGVVQWEMYFAKKQ